MSPQIACVVEGHGDVESVPLLVRRFAQESGIQVHLARPLRVPKARLLKPKELERTVELAARVIRRSGAILVVMDADDDCPADLGPRVLARAVEEVGDVPIGVVLAKREYEAWFLAGAASIAGHRGLPTDLDAPAAPEEVRGAKEWLANRMPRPYSAVLDQPALTSVLDLHQTRGGSESFDKCAREIARLVRLCGQG